MKVVEFRIENDAHQFGCALNTVIRRGRIPRGIIQQNTQFGLGEFSKSINQCNNRSKVYCRLY